MAKAVANATTAAFITMVGSEFVQKYLGEGPRMVRDVFRLARENSPAIVFIDEIGERAPPHPCRSCRSRCIFSCCVLLIHLRCAL
jgi:SpoVK/Ycf46/Vps4 family AAA+-type ATPase